MFLVLQEENLMWHVGSPCIEYNNTSLERWRYKKIGLIFTDYLYLRSQPVHSLITCTIPYIVNRNFVNRQYVELLVKR